MDEIEEYPDFVTEGSMFGFYLEGCELDDALELINTVDILSSEI